MTALWRPRAVAISKRTSRRHYWGQPVSSPHFEAGDHVLLRLIRDPTKSIFVRQQLAPDKEIHSHTGVIRHADILGRRVRDVVRSNRGAAYTLHQPTLEQYLLLTRRLVTPIYPSSASTIVSLLDLDARPGPAVRILEGGTGHAGLTLYLARAVQALLVDAPAQPVATVAATEGSTPTSRAVIATVDRNTKTSAHAAQLLRAFRNGLYAPAVSFHTGDLAGFLASAESRPDAPFTHAVLDFPGAHADFAAVAERLADDAKLVVYNPSVTQIAECVQAVHDLRLPLELDRVVELGQGTSGGREWDVRIAKVRAVERERAAIVGGTEGAVDEGIEHGNEVLSGIDGNQADVEEAVNESVEAEDEGLEVVASDPPQYATGTTKGLHAVVCRPRAGYMIVVGGFIGLWRKKAAHEKVGVQ